ncbi:MAG: substrate-binding domain-containing protein [Actinobacteria bacterium]|nr:substrate-binding domain-containing protein [Actinomycetota bacterium]
MSRHHFRRAGLGLAAAASVAILASACMPADGVQQTITVAGSDTTQDVMAALTADIGASDFNADPDTIVNVLSQQLAPITAPADDHCSSITYATPAGSGQTLAPNGSSAGRDALKASVQAGDGCIDVARSSSGPRAIGSDLASFRYFAFGLDAVGWTSASTRAPANLTLAQLRGIFDCTYTNWNQVGGTAGAIQRYYPQAGSGTRAFFQSDVLGFDPTTISTGTCPAVKLTQENSGQTIATNGDQLTAIVGYSAANFVAQTRGTAPDQRSGQTLRQLNGQSLTVGSGASMTLNTAGPVTEANVKLNNPTPAYPGIRYVFNVLDNTSASFDAANRFFGFVNATDGGKSPLCNGSKESIIASYGFGPLDTTTSARNLAGSNCREFQP